VAAIDVRRTSKLQMQDSMDPVEIKNSKANLKLFAEALVGAHVEAVVLNEDLHPVFDKDQLPFKFRYAGNAIFKTNRGNYKIIASTVSDGLHSFWTEKLTDSPMGTYEYLIDSDVLAISFQSYYDPHFPYKMEITFSNYQLFFLCGEIENAPEHYFASNEEMLLVFDNSSDVLRCESLHGRWNWSNGTLDKLPLPSDQPPPPPYL
jgi:hypothetical protein